MWIVIEKSCFVSIYFWITMDTPSLLTKDWNISSDFVRRWSLLKPLQFIFEWFQHTLHWSLYRKLFSVFCQLVSIMDPCILGVEMCCLTDMFWNFIVQLLTSCSCVIVFSFHACLNQNVHILSSKITTHSWVWPGSTVSLFRIFEVLYLDWQLSEGMCYLQKCLQNLLDAERWMN